MADRTKFGTVTQLNRLHPRTL